VRNRGTIGGDLAHGDPANDHPAAAIALDAAFVLYGPQGERTVPHEKTQVRSGVYGNRAVLVGWNRLRALKRLRGWA